MNEAANKNKTVTIVPTNEAAQAEFVKKIGKPKDGSNNYVDTFLLLIGYVISEKRSFTMSDLQTLAKPHDLPALELARLAGIWIKTWMDLGKLDSAFCAYDENVYILV